MALYHVSQSPCPIVEFPSDLNACHLTVGDLHMVDVIPVPQGFQQQVGEAENEDILHRLFS